MVGRGGFEPPTTCLQFVVSCQAGILTRLDDRPKVALNEERREIKTTQWAAMVPRIR